MSDAAEQRLDLLNTDSGKNIRKVRGSGTIIAPFVTVSNQINKLSWKMVSINVTSKSNKQKNVENFFFLLAVLRIHDILGVDLDPDPAIFVIDLQDARKFFF
jgi:hypothetical protein